MLAVIAALRSPARRISIAIMLSAMVHAAILWLPHLQLPHDKVQLPPLSARLVALPKPVDQPAAKTEPISQASLSGSTPPAKPQTNTVDTMKIMEKSASTHPFPKHLHLSFAIYRGTDYFRVGELSHRLDIDQDRYALQANRQTIGLTRLLASEQLTQTSYGKIGEHGLHPESFKEEKYNAGNVQELKTQFDWSTQKLHFAQGNEAALPADVQDILSFMYQLSQLTLRGEFISLPITDGKKLEQFQIEIGVKEELSTPMGKLRALHLRKMHVQGEAYFEIWLGLEYRLLPVKFRQVDGSDNMIEEFVISDIRAADE
jgi:hypothetical protein